MNDLLGGPLPTEEAEKKPLVEDEFNDEESHPEEPKFEVPRDLKSFVQVYGLRGNNFSLNLTKLSHCRATL